MCLHWCMNTQRQCNRKLRNISVNIDIVVAGRNARNRAQKQKIKEERLEEAKEHLWTNLRQQVLPPTYRPSAGTRNMAAGLWFSVVIALLLSLPTGVLSLPLAALVLIFLARCFSRCALTN